MRNETLAQVAAIVGSVGAALVLVPRPRRLALFAGIGLLALAEGALAAALLPRDDLERFASPAGGAALVVAIAAVGALGWGFVRHPAWVPVGLLLAAPFRVPVDLGSQHAFLLLPLYLVLAGATVALLYRAARDDTLAPLAAWIAIPAAAFVGWAALSLVWALDPEQGAIDLLFFAFPFVCLLAVVARSPWTEWLPRALATTLLVLGAAFAALGLYQAWSHTLVFAQDLRVANAYTTYFRVTSLFKDPSIYGRHLVLALAVLVVLLWLGRVRLAYAIALVAVLFGGLYFSYSQSSMLVLFAVVLGATVLLADRRSRTVVIVAALAVAVAGGAFAAVAAKDTGLQRATSGRSRLVSVTGHVIANHPVVGVGIGSQPLASRRELDTRRRAAKNASHTTPLTVLAELGAVGFVLYLAFLLGAAKVLREATRLQRITGIGLATAFCVLLLHSLFYSGFFEDPIMWGILGVASLLVATFAREHPVT